MDLVQSLHVLAKNRPSDKIMNLKIGIWHVLGVQLPLVTNSAVEDKRKIGVIVKDLYLTSNDTT